MKLTSPIYIFLFLLTGIPVSYGQKGTDSVDLSKAGKAAVTDAYYFDAIKARLHDDNSKAKGLLEQFIAARPEQPAGYYELAKIYSDQKVQDKATANIKKAMALDTANKWYKETYAAILASGGDPEGAAAIFAQLSVIDPQNADYLIMAAENYEKARKYQEALTYLDMALKKSYNDEDIQLHKMHLYLTMNDVEKAVAVVQQLIERYPNEGKYYKLAGEIYDNNKAPEKATAVYEHALKVLPDDPAVQIGIAEHYLKKGDTVSYKTYLKKAITNNDIEIDTQLELLSAYMQSLPDGPNRGTEGMPLIDRIVAQHPNDAMVLAFYGEMLESGNKKDSALWAYKRSLELKPGNFAVWGKLLSSYLDKEYADSLIKYTAKAIRLFPNQAIVHFYNGVGYMNKKNYPAAIKAMDRAIQMQPEDDKPALAGMYSTLGDVYNLNKQYDRSDEAFEKALQLDPDNETVLNNYSYYLSERGKKLDVAERMSKHALDLRPGEATFMDTYGWILYKKGDYEQARTYIQRAIDASLKNADATLYDHLGNVYYKLNNKEKALESWKISKERGGGGDDPQLDKKIREGKLYE